ncbi:rhomboid-like protein 14, mitochondrial [Phragmites australis]|uniref:rhomboid-like protein 14, mitochondrial n=1 Tax=Phragmites australis TaxID=29695 RepID=UPI002D797D37|nr:rhomboid-like protein 14, mitochondrial [Phragmites australis]
MGSGMSSGRRRGSGLEGSRGLLPVLALQVLLEYGPAGAARPPVTAALLAANALVYLRPGALDGLLPSLQRASFNPHLIMKYGDLTRFFLSAFYHLSETHLFYNMTSLLWKGIQLETSMGSTKFASMVAALLGLSQGITLLLSKGLLLLGDDTTYYDQYAVGFSGVLFGMKVVLNAWSDDFVYLHGMVIPSKYAAWAELVLIQAFIPGTSFLGHLGGILAGLVYLWLERSFNGPDPLSLLISSVTKVVSWPVKFAQRLLRSVRSQGHITGRGRVGRRASARETPQGIWRCSTCTYDNSLATDVCEMCSNAREDRAFSRRQHHQAGGNVELSVEEIRRRRLQRFGR